MDTPLNTFKGVMSSDGAFYGRSEITGGDTKPPSIYMRRYWFGQLRLHVFLRGDADLDPHDHPWPFWTFPLTSYVEEVTTEYELIALEGGTHTFRYSTNRQIVRAFRLHYRPSSHTHRVLGLWSGTGTAFRAGNIITIVWRGKKEREWGFLKYRDGRWCWTHFREYIFGGGRSAPCE